MSWKPTSHGSYVNPRIGQFVLPEYPGRSVEETIRFHLRLSPAHHRFRVISCGFVDRVCLGGNDPRIHTNSHKVKTSEDLELRTIPSFSGMRSVPIAEADVRYTLVCRVVTLRSTGFRNRSRFLKSVEYTEAHDKLKCIGHPLPRRDTDCDSRETIFVLSEELSICLKNESRADAERELRELISARARMWQRTPKAMIF